MIKNHNITTICRRNCLSKNGDRNGLSVNLYSTWLLGPLGFRDYFNKITKKKTPNLIVICHLRFTNYVPYKVSMMEVKFVLSENSRNSPSLKSKKTGGFISYQIQEHGWSWFL